MSRTRARVAIGLGSNLGDRLSHLRTGARAMSRVLKDLHVSPVYASAAQGVERPQPDYLNAVLVGATTLSPGELLTRARDTEAQAGRTRPYPDAPRTLDVDILLYDDRVVEEEELRIPHPEWKTRAFVLAPLSRVAPSWRDPEGGRTVAELWRDLAPELGRVEEVAPPTALLETVAQP